MGTVQKYIPRFYTIFAKTEWDDDTLVAIYYKGLKDHIKDKLLKEEASRNMEEIVKKAIYYKGLKDHIKDKLSKEEASRDMEEIVEKAIKIDECWEKRRMKRRNQNLTWIPSQKAQ